MRGGRQNRGMRRMIDKMGLDMKEMSDVREVTIKTNNKEIIIENPTVTEMKGKDSTIFTITAEDYSERELEVPMFNDDDLDMICDQTGVDKEKAQAALTDADGDIARAIMMLEG